MPEPTSSLQALLDRAAITDAIVGAADAFDAQDWERLRSYLLDEIRTDYSDFRGEAPARVRADAYVAARRQGLSGLKTLHVSTNHQICIDGDTAWCRSAYRIYRVDPSRPSGEDRLDTAGHYEHGLQRTSAGWRIASIRQTVLFRVGPADIHGAFRPSASADVKD
ncbi:MAG TPA: nuclear transport factor 2 family protein [Holophagaceae bacterium]|nr:nuclear transport factor 2 family protein [Holophagaceae bacterium]